MTVVTKPEFVNQIESLPSLPAVVSRLMEVMSSPTVSIDQVVEVISEDQAIVAKILRIANSPFYGVRGQINRVSRAVVRLGMVAVRNIVLGLCTRNTMLSVASETPEFKTLWNHSIAVASACDLIAHRVGYQPAEEAFIAGLLHDIGQTAMVVFQPELFQASLRNNDRQVGFLTHERELFGIDHTEAGSHILTQWGLPESFSLVAKKHHTCEIDSPDSVGKLQAIVILSDTIAQIMGMCFDFSLGQSKRTKVAAEYLHLTDSYPVCIMEQLERRVKEITEIFATTDNAAWDPQSIASRPAAWVSQKATDDEHLGQLLLEHVGYEVRCVQPDCVDSDLSDNDLIIVASAREDNFKAAEKLAISLSGRGYDRIVLLASDDCDVSSRSRNENTGIFYIPRIFTMFDLKWIGEQLGL